MDALSNPEARERRLDSSAPVSETTLMISKGEAIVAAAIFTLILILHWFYLNRFRWDSDEPQHLHVVWAWANGLLPYRDVFDNHSPLFHWLCWPVFAWLAERPDIVAGFPTIQAPGYPLYFQEHVRCTRGQRVIHCLVSTGGPNLIKQRQKKKRSMLARA